MASKPLVLPLIPLRGIVVFPHMILHFDVTRKHSVAALEAAVSAGQRVFLCTQTSNAENPSDNELYKIGTVSEIKQLLKLPSGGVRILIEGLYRAEKKGSSTKRIPNMRIIMDAEKEALMRFARKLFQTFCETFNRTPPDAMYSAATAKSMGDLADIIAGYALHDIKDKQAILATQNPQIRLENAIELLQNEIEILRMERNIVAKVSEKIEQNQRNLYLREQIKVIEDELARTGNANEELQEYRNKLSNLPLSAEYKHKLNKEIKRLEKGEAHSSDIEVIRTYLDTVFDLPWNTKTNDKNSIATAERILESEHFGLHDVKERILEFLSVRKLNNNTHSQVLCLVGPPGVGKTSIAKSVAHALGRRFARISLGGVRDEAEIRGHRKTYVAAMPGRVIKAFSTANSNNPVILLDEIDKMSCDFKGDPASALLEVLDIEQNSQFRDHYLEIPFSLSNAFFIATANSLENIPRPLIDRMEVINVGTYTADEKLQIALRYLIPKQRKEAGIKSGSLVIRKSAVVDIINYYTREAGVRNLERQIGKICRKVARKLIGQPNGKTTVSAKNLSEFLGKRIYRFDTANKINEIGVATGLAWTQLGGETMPIEVNIAKGKGKLELTGHLGDTMKESAKAAISFVRSKAHDFKIDEDFYIEKDIHIHVPEAATPKDGPSAGITIASALISALTNIPIKSEVAMTGEITLRGRVLPIGGLKEKALAAHRMGIKTVIIPNENSKDIDDIPENVSNELRFIPVDNMEEVMASAFAKRK